MEKPTIPGPDRKYFNASTYKMGEKDVKGKDFFSDRANGKEDSIFSALKPQPPAPPPAPAEASRTLKAKIEEPGNKLKKVQEIKEWEEKQARNPPSSPESSEMTGFLKAKVEDLEKKLFNLQEKALASAMELKSREEAQREARRESEDMLRTIRANQHSAEFDRYLREHMGRLEDRLKELETGFSTKEKKLEAVLENRSAKTEKKFSVINNMLSLAAKFFAKEKDFKAALEARLAEMKKKLSGIDIKGLEAAFSAKEKEFEAALEARLAEMEKKLPGIDIKGLEAAFSAKEKEFEAAAEFYVAEAAKSLSLSNMEECEAGFSLKEKEFETIMENRFAKTEEKLSALNAEKYERTAELTKKFFDRADVLESRMRKFEQDISARLNSHSGAVGEQIRCLEAKAGIAGDFSRALIERMNEMESGWTALTVLLGRMEQLEEKVKGLSAGSGFAGMMKARLEQIERRLSDISSGRDAGS
ncbi:MAG: hypothetical protein ABIG11_05915 [bacterium]